MSPNPDAMKSPSYKEVCSGETGHVEVLNIELAPSDNLEKIFEDLIRFFFQFHDPTTPNRQGNDIGSQYASIIFCSDVKQTEIAEKVKKELQGLMSAGKIKTSYTADSVTTTICNMNQFYPAHEDHQQYLQKNPNGYCNQCYRFSEWPRRS